MRELNPRDVFWAVRRLPAPVAKLLKTEGPRLFVAGGYLRDCVSGERPRDIDLFVPDAGRALRLAVSLHLGVTPEQVPDEWLTTIGTPAAVAFSMTENAVTLKWSPAVQFITRWTFDTPQACVESFDFTVGMAALWWQPGEPGQWMSTCHDDFYADLAAHRLVYTSPKRNEDAGGSLVRVLKFYQRGFRIPMESFGATIARLVMAVELEQLRSIAKEEREAFLAKVLTGLLREVDPMMPPDGRYIEETPSPEPGVEIP